MHKCDAGLIACLSTLISNKLFGMELSSCECACREVQLEHALLLYFAGEWDEAYQELQLYKQHIGQLDGHTLDSTLARISCLLHERTTW